MEKVIFLLIFVLSFVSCHAETGIDSALKKMRETNCYMGSAVSEAGEMPEQYELYETVRDTATTKQLEKLLSDKNGVIRAYAIQALVHVKRLKSGARSKSVSLCHPEPVSA